MSLQRALVVVHHPPDDPLLARFPGSVGERFVELGFDVDIRSVDDLPGPATFEVLVVMGSSRSAYDDTVPWLAGELAFVAEAALRHTPVLGICFGGQLLARALGGTVARSPEPEMGWVTVDTDRPDVVSAGPWMNFHVDRFTVPPGATEVARTDLASQAFTIGPHLGVQFHPEMTRDVIDTWFATWEHSGSIREAFALGADPDALRAEARAREPGDRARAAALIDAFLDRAETLRHA
ncbi:MAG: type 1 glutamine amidotransferase [Acidimicrobiales bacterium]